MSNVTAFIIICLFSTLFSFLVLKLVQRRADSDKLKQNHEIGAIMFNAFGLVYAVFVAFMVFAVWNEYQAAEANIELEVNQLSLLLRNASSLNTDLRNEIKADLADYADSVVNHDWENMAAGKRITSAMPLGKLWKTVSQIPADSLKTSQIFSIYYENLNNLSKYRTLRVIGSKYGLPPILWFVLLFGALISVCYSFFFNMNKFVTQVIFTSILLSFTLMMLYLIYCFDHPYSGANKITAGPFIDFLTMVRNIK